MIRAVLFAYIAAMLAAIVVSSGASNLERASFKSAESVLVMSSKAWRR